MDRLYSGSGNSRIVNGSFPQYELKCEECKFPFALNIEQRAETGLAILREIPVLLHTLLPAFWDGFCQIETLQQPGFFEKEVNFLINTGINPKVINTLSEEYLSSVQLIPFITPLDKALWYGICTYGVEITNGDPQKKDDMVCMFFALLHLLNSVQTKELANKKTLNLSAINASTSLIDLLLGPWDNQVGPYFRILSSEEVRAMEQLFHDRTNLRNKLCVNNEYAKSVAQHTQKEWELFVSILNDLALLEKNSLNKVCSPLPTNEKLLILTNYNAILHGIEQGCYHYNGENVLLLPIFEAVDKRMQDAPAYCLVSDCFGDAYRLYPLALNLAMKPETFNCFFLAYHNFRLDPSKENASRFATLALSCLKRNFNISHLDDFDSIDETVEAFCATVIVFAKTNKASIESLSFEIIQEDSVTFGEASLASTITDAYDEHLSEMILKAEEQLSSVDMATLIERIGMHSYSQFDLEDQINAENQQLQLIANQSLARQLVISMNIIYLFNDAIRIMQDNGLLGQVISRKIRTILRRVDRDLVGIVYSTIDVDEYREDTMIYSASLVDKEKQADQQENQNHQWTLANTFKDIVSAITAELKNADPNSLLTTKIRIREEIQQYPSTGLTADLCEWIDDISDQISAALIAFVQQRNCDYDETQKVLLAKLGANSHKLPPFALSSLTTAELLYSQYATEHYANKGFDYSCISALYYQAFEEAYNKLIWTDYAIMLNELEIDGVPFTKVLRDFKGKDLQQDKLVGYLPIKSGDRQYYTNKKHNAVMTSCTYGNFGELLKRYITPNSNLIHLCDHFAKQAGFPDHSVMFKDGHFMLKVRELAESVLAAKDQRNEASHGGKLITIKQCQSDKQTVLNELEEVRENSIGLIQKLLYLMKNSPITFKS